jgi:hypothetical protein
MSEDHGECWSGYERRRPSAEIERLHTEIADIKKSISEMSNAISVHIARSDDIAPALQELVSLWRASKIIGYLCTGLAALLASLWAAYLWARDHVRL